MVYNLELLETLDCMVQELFILELYLLIVIYENDKSDEASNKKLFCLGDNSEFRIEDSITNQLEL